MSTTIEQARGPQDIAAVRELFLEYARWLDVDLCFQGFERELAELPGDYAPPLGRLLLARIGGQPAGCIALRAFDAATGEVKRLYVRPAHRGTGLGGRLVKRVVAAARKIGYARLVLDTLDRMPEAVALYRKHRFQPILAYYANPIPGAMYFELPLKESSE